MAKSPDFEREYINYLQARGEIVDGRYQRPNGIFISSNGEQTLKLGNCFIEKIRTGIGLRKFSNLFGLDRLEGALYVLSIGLALSRRGMTRGITFSRGTRKEYGETELFIGDRFEDGRKHRVLVVNDQFFSAKQFQNALEALPPNVNVVGILVGVDSVGPKVLEEYTSRTGTPIWSITSDERIPLFLP